MKKCLALLLTGSLALTLAACGAEQQKYEEPDANPQVITPAEEGKNGSTANNPEANASDSPDIKLNVPIGVASPLPSETEKLPALEKLMIDEWKIPKEAQATTRYYYNYADLNGDGKDELLALAVGDYTSGSGGSSALIATKDGDNWKIMQTLTVVQPPVIVSDTETNGWKDLFVQTNDPSLKNGYRVLKFDGKQYPNTPDGTALEDIENQSGTAIFYNDLAADVTSGTALTLG